LKHTKNAIPISNMIRGKIREGVSPNLNKVSPMKNLSNFYRINEWDKRR